MCTAATRCHKVTLGNDTMPQWVLFHLIKYTAHCISIRSSRDKILNSQRGVNASLWINFWLHSEGNLFANERDRKSSIRLWGASSVILEAQSLFALTHSRVWTQRGYEQGVWQTQLSQQISRPALRHCLVHQPPSHMRQHLDWPLQGLELMYPEIRSENSLNSTYLEREPTLRKCILELLLHSSGVGCWFYKQTSSN